MPVPAGVSPTDRVHAKIDELLASDGGLPEILEEVARLGAQLLMQAASEAEVTGFLGRDRYKRAAATADAQPGARNGYRPARVKTTAGQSPGSGPSFDHLVEDFNRFPCGWARYFRYGNSAVHFEKIRSNALMRIAGFIAKKHRCSFGRWVIAFASDKQLGLIRLDGTVVAQAFWGLAGGAESRR